VYVALTTALGAYPNPAGYDAGCVTEPHMPTAFTVVVPVRVNGPA
jgi:hypothetical protein